MNIVFQQSDFVLCNVPVPVGYKQSQTHSGVASYDGKFFLTTSPYPSGGEIKWKSYLRAALNKLSINLIKPFIPEQWENPLLYVGVTFDPSAFPVDFKLMQSTPLMPPPDPYYGLPAFNSDPDIHIEDGIIHVLNRQTYRTKICPGEPLNKYRNRIYHIYGRIDNDRFYYLGTELLIDTDNLVCSPCLTKFKGHYLLTELETNSYNEGDNFKGLYIATSDSIAGFKEHKEWTKVEVLSGKYLPWHMSLFSYDDRLYTIIACVEKGVSHRLWQLLGEFDHDLKTLRVYNIPLTDFKSYRGSAFVNSDGIFVLYNTTVHEKIKGGQSVDGREIIMAHMPFEQLLTIVRENEV